MLNVVSLSGGKGSTAMLLIMLERNMPIDKVLYEYEMYEHISKVASYTLLKLS